MRVLIVEDDDAIRQLLGRIVARDGVEVASVDGALAAIALLTRETFDLVLLDLMMPIHSGFDVIDHLRANRGRARTVVVMSAADDDLLRKIDPEVVHGLLRKPFDLSAVLELVRGVRQTSLDPLQESAFPISTIAPLLRPRAGSH